MRLLMEFDNFKKEQSLVGRMLMAYGEFEFGMAKLVGYANDDDQDMAMRILFRVHGEGARIDVTDAIVRPFFEKLGLNGQWGNAFGALRHCKSIRNQYAHCNWHSEDRLWFVNMDTDAASPQGELILQLYPTDLELLLKQHEYFEYTAEWLYFLDCHCRRRLGRDTPDSKVPKSIPQPPLSNRQKTPPPATIT